MDFTIKPQREYKDRLFKAIFGRNTEDSKRWRLDLYNALNNTSYTDPEALEVNTIENVIYITMKNDVSFLVDSEMNLYEQQSTHNPKCNKPLQKSCKALYDYIRYVYRIKDNRKSGMDKKEAVEEALDWAIREKLLDGFFKEQKEEVIGMSLTEFDEEEFKRICREDGYEDGISVGLAQGASQKAVEAAVTLIHKYNATPEDAAKDMGAPLEEVLDKLKKELASVNS